MAKNDRILLDGIIDDRIAIRLPSDKQDEAFEFLVFEQLLKDYDLSKDEIIDGAIDGRQDGGIDGFFVLVNGHLLQDPESFMWPKSNAELKLLIITCKHHDTFKQATLDSLIATLTEIFDFSIKESELTGAYSDILLKKRKNLIYAYRKLSPRLTNYFINIYYASRGDTSSIGEEVASRGRQIASLAKDSFGGCVPEFYFIGSSELVDLHRKKKNYTLELEFEEALYKGERYVILAKLSDYFRFISDEGKLRRYLFDSNVRDFMGLNRVNEDIKATLEQTNSPDFWWLNNGITIIATSAAITGKSIQATDVQIVNGLQTTESIFLHFIQNNPKDDDRCVLVKVIVTNDKAIRDNIIRATNNQTDVELASLHATDKIQRDIEDILLRHGIYYERRKNYYANQNRKPEEIVTPLYAAAGYVALVLKKPHKAISLKNKFMQNPDTYSMIFDEKASLEVWPNIVKIFKKIDSWLEAARPKSNITENFLKGWRYVIALLLISNHYKKFSFSIRELIDYNVELITKKNFDVIWTYVNKPPQSTRPRSWWVNRTNVINMCVDFAKKHNIPDIKRLMLPEYSPNISYKRPKKQSHELSPTFLAEVRDLLPAQPWKPGIHRKIIRELGCTPSKFSAAIDRLIDDGFFCRQQDGVLYDAEGNVIDFDSERVNPETLELMDSRESSH